MHYTRTFGLYTDTFFFILLYTRTRVILNAWPCLLTDLIKFWDMEISEHGNLGTWNLVICQNILKYVEISCYMLKYDEIC